MTITLFKSVDRYELSKEISSGYAENLRNAVKRLNRFLKRESTLEDLCFQTINEWLKYERDFGEIADRTRANHRRSILTIWAKYGSGLNRSEIRSVILTPKNPEAWTYQELKLVADAACQVAGVLKNGIRRAQYLETCLWFAFESGMRRSDLWDFELRLIDSDNRAAFTQHKSRRVHVVQFTEETVSAMRDIARQLKARRDPCFQTPLKWPQSERQFYFWLKRCRVLSGVDPEERNRAMQHVRRTGATEVDRQGDAPWRFLGHSREGLDRKCYVDARKTVVPITPHANRSHGIRANE